MDKRLNDTVLANSYDAGHQSLSWNPGQAGGLLAGIDLQAIIDSPDAAQIVPSLPVQPLYYALKQRGFEDSLEILALLSTEQVVHMADYEVWDGEDFSQKRMFKFLKPFGEISSEQLYNRFADLDEEYQIATLEGIFTVHEVEHIYDLPLGVEDRAFPMPCHTVFYEMALDEKEDIDFVEGLMESVREHNMSYAYALLSHSTFNPPAENEAQVLQFRKARLEEDGFVSYEDSLRIFSPLDRRSLRLKWQNESGVDANEHSKDALMLQGSDLNFFDACLLRAREDGADVEGLFNVHQSLLYLANALCAAARVTADDLHGLHRVLEQGKALASLGLEYLADGSIDLGSKIVLGEHPKSLFQAGYGVIEDLRGGTIKALRRMNLPRTIVLERLYISRQWGQMLLEIDRNWLDLIGMEASEILKGLLNRFPMVAVGSTNDTNRIEFRPISSLADAYELELSVQAVMAYFANIVLSGRELDRPFEVILRDMATESLSKGLQPMNWDIEGSTAQLLDAWRDHLRNESTLWMIGERQSREESLSLAISMIHDGLHGLIVLPKVPSRSPSHEEMI
ncbi:MAG: hypothetical protein H7318_03530 [Oligoflexus sp.]|nr:hypothetical protein [Oligoflexus sp.]